MVRSVQLLTLLATLFLTALPSQAQVQWLGTTQIPGTAQDLSGLSGNLETQTPIDAFGGLSAIDYTGRADRYLVLSDRGPGDGAASFPCRFHEIELRVDPTSKAIRFELIQTHLMTDLQDHPLTGSLEQLKSWNRGTRCPSYDPEGIRCMPNNTVVISDEYGPHIDLFDPHGKMLQSIPVPEKFGLSDRRVPPLVFGAFPNRGLEGIAVTPSGDTVVAAMQGPLVQDGRIEKNKCLGTRTRWIVHRPLDPNSTEFIYPLEDESTGVSEVLAVDEERFLVLERDSRIGSEAKIKKIYLADTQGASDVSAVDSLRSDQQLPPNTRFIQKKLLIDLLDPSYGMSGADAPEKPEGIAWGPRLPDQRRLLIVCFDNDFEPSKNTLFTAFAIAGLD
jgi:hypothetical protein